MEDKKREEVIPNDVNNGSDNQVVSEDTSIDSNVRVEPETAPKKQSVILPVILALFLVVGSVTYVLERDGRINTNIFSAFSGKVSDKTPAAKVNGKVITMGDFNTSLKQQVEVAKSHDMDVTNEMIMADIRSQAIDILVSAEILRQEAIKRGITASEEQVESRYNEVQEGVGGEEILKARMAEFGIEAKDLKRDIENDILIQGLFDQIIAEDELAVSDEEAAEYYTMASNGSEDFPPFEEVKELIVQQITLEKQQQQVSVYIEELRAGADIEILI